jgi:ankyrin repeat protein
MLVEFGVDLECQDNEGHSPLHLAVEGGHIETVEVLINRGANVNARSNRGATPLYMAKAIGYDDISQFLVDRGASSSPPLSLPSSSFLTLQPINQS